MIFTSKSETTAPNFPTFRSTSFVCAHVKTCAHLFVLTFSVRTHVCVPVPHIVVTRSQSMFADETEIADEFGKPCVFPTDTNYDVKYCGTVAFIREVTCGQEKRTHASVRREMVSVLV